MNFEMLPAPNLCFCMSKFSFKYTNELLYVIATVLLVSLTKPMKKYGICRKDSYGCEFEPYLHIHELEISEINFMEFMQ